jgi:hypothetical protein
MFRGGDRPALDGCGHEGPRARLPARRSIDLLLNRQLSGSFLAEGRDLEVFFSERLGFTVDYVKGTNGDNLVVHDVVNPAGPLAGQVCDIALQSNGSIPFMPHPAFHTKPAVVAMGTTNGTTRQITAEWQY